MQVFERCHELEVVDIVPARWTAAQDMLLWQTVQLQHLKPCVVNTHMSLLLTTWCCMF